MPKISCSIQSQFTIRWLLYISFSVHTFPWKECILSNFNLRHNGEQSVIYWDYIAKKHNIFRQGKISVTSKYLAYLDFQSTQCVLNLSVKHSNLLPVANSRRLCVDAFYLVIRVAQMVRTVQRLTPTTQVL